MFLKKRLVIVTAFVLVFVVIGHVFAANFNLTVPRFGGSVTTYNENKASANSSIYVGMSAVGAGYSVYATAEDVANYQIAGTGSWMTTGTVVFWPDIAPAGATRHLRFTNSIVTTVAVQVIGTWAP